MAKMCRSCTEDVIGPLLLAVLIGVDELVSTRPWIHNRSRVGQVAPFAAQRQHALAPVRIHTPERQGELDEGFTGIVGGEQLVRRVSCSACPASRFRLPAKPLP
jgi:hypothetical protein